jgi:hypothetical protein
MVEMGICRTSSKRSRTSIISLPRQPSNMESQLAAYKTLLITARAKAGTGNAAFNSAVASFEPLFFNNLVMVLDGFFVHRSRTLEGKDGNPLNEFRTICSSLLQNHGVMCPDLKPYDAVVSRAT